MKAVRSAICALAVAAASFAACSQNSTTVAIRSFERADRSAFLCLDATQDAPGRALESCRTISPVLAFNDFATAPHAVALVTQQTRGELAIVDVTAGSVVDADPSVPGFNFFPVGSVPTDVVSTLGSSAAFVASGDPNRPALFGLPTRLLSPFLLQSPNRVAPTLATLPACSLPGVPGEVVVLLDPAGKTAGTSRALCGGGDAPADLTLAAERALFGTAKLAVTLPARGELVIIDAATVLSSAPGSFDPCPIERTVPLSGDPKLATAPTADAATSSDGAIDAGVTASSDGAMEAGVTASSDAGAADASAEAGAMCVVGLPGSSSPRSTQAHPHHLSLSDDGRLFISDDESSVIHVVDVHDPCAAVEILPLVPSSLADPSRAVTAGAIAVSPLTSDQKRFVYAVDVKDNGSLMIFDVSDGAASRAPILRPDVQRNNAVAPDRFVMPAPVQSLTFAAHEVPLSETQQSGTFERGHLCDPTNASDPYRTQDGVTTSAGPQTLRGIYAFLTLSNGQLRVLDVDDYDRACRRPLGTDSSFLGCAGSTESSQAFPAASAEASCNVVERHMPRSAQFFSNQNQIQRAPAMQTFPQLADQNGAILTIDPQRAESSRRPKLLGPDLGAMSLTARALVASVNTVATDDFNASFSPLAYGDSLTANVAKNNWVAFDLHEPRVHTDQTWRITYEGAIGNFAATKGRFQCADPARQQSPALCERGDTPSHFDFYDETTGFCDRGVEGGTLANSLGVPSGDILQIVEPLLDDTDPYWATVTDPACSRQSCEAKFGTPDVPALPRELEIETAFQNHLVLKGSHRSTIGAADPALACCFPYPVSYTVRGGKHWIVTGSRTGFQHHLQPDAAGACVASCDPNLALLNGRAVGRPSTQPVIGLDDPQVFRNAQLRFVVWEPPCVNEMVSCVGRDWSFSFDEVGGFAPMSFGLASGTLVLPQSTRFVPGLSQLAIVDAASQGLVLFDLNSLGVVTPFF